MKYSLPLFMLIVSTMSIIAMNDKEIPKVDTAAELDKIATDFKGTADRLKTAQQRKKEQEEQAVSGFLSAFFNGRHN